MTPSVIYYSTDARKNEIYLLNRHCKKDENWNVEDLKNRLGKTGQRYCGMKWVHGIVKIAVKMIWTHKEEKDEESWSNTLWYKKIRNNHPHTKPRGLFLFGDYEFIVLLHNKISRLVVNLQGHCFTIRYAPRSVDKSRGVGNETVTPLSQYHLVI